MRDGSRLLTTATEAFIDGTAIDWPALLRRTRSLPDGALFESLSTLAAVRDDFRSTLQPGAASRPVTLTAWLVVGLAALQTVSLLGLAAAAVLDGQPIANRGWQLVVALTFSAAAFPVGLAAFRDVHSLFLLATLAASAAVFARSVVSGLPADWLAPLDPILRRIWIEAFVPACLWQFALGFPRVRRFTPFDRLARRATAVVWVLGVVLFAANVALAGRAIGVAPIDYLLRDHSSRLFWRLFSLALVPPVVAILVRTRRAPVDERRRVARLALAIAAGYGPVALFGVLRTVLPGIDSWFSAADSAGSIWLYRAILGALAATPILSAAAVLADRPFELQSLVQLTSPSVWAASVRRLVKDMCRRPRSFAESVERISLARGSRETAAALTDALRECTGARIVELLLPDRDGVLASRSSRVSPLSADGALAAVLRDAVEPIEPAALMSLLPPADRRWAESNDVCLVAALKRPDGEIGAVVALGPRAGGLPFDRRDRWTVMTLTTTAAAAWRDAAVEPGQSEAALECPQCGAVVDAEPLPCACGADASLAALPAVLAGKFRVNRRIGAGGMGIAYLARDEMLDRDVALKTLPRLRHPAARLVREEARAMAALSHESLATLYGVETWRHTPVLVVEYCPEGTLADRLAPGPLRPGGAIALGIRLGRALVYMHARGVLHRDVKPSNIAFSDGAPKLLDFGLSARTNERLAGSAAYLPPEAFRGAAPTGANDLWALATVMLEAVGGWPALDRAPALRSFLERALDESPALRFTTGREFVAALEKLTN